VKIISEKLRPDYSKPKSTYKSKTGAAGEVEVMVYSSKDGTVEYTMFKDKEGKVWFGDVYTKTGSTNRYAVKDGSYDFDAVLAPRWEYEKQIPIIYESKNRVKSPVNSRYHSNWNYVREMPEVKRWYESQGLKVPEGD